ncbi:ankyrin repeat domain-containing protein, partial [archaeon]
MSKTEGEKVFNEFVEGEQDLRGNSPIHTPMTRLNFLSSNTNQIIKQIRSTSYDHEASRVLLEMTKDPSISLYRIVEIMQYGAKPTDTCDNTGKTAFHHVAFTGNHAVMKFLCRFAEWPVNSRDKSMQTPLMVAAKALPGAHNTKTVKHLLQRRDILIDELDMCGYNALYYAWEKRNAWVVRLLLKKRASVITCLKEFAEEIPVLYDMCKFLDLHAHQTVAAMSAMHKPEHTHCFFSATQMHMHMVDFYSALRVRWSVAVQGARYAVDGMVMLGLREELRYMKKFDNTQALIKGLGDVHIEMEGGGE